MSDPPGQEGASTGRPPLYEPPSGTPLPRTEARDPVRTIARILRATFIVVGLAMLLWALADAFVTIILAVFLAVLLRGLGNSASRHVPLSPAASSVIIFLLLLLGVFGLGYWVAPHLVAEGENLWSKVSSELGSLSALFGSPGGAAANGGDSGSIAHVISGHTGVIGGLLKTVGTSFVGLLAATLVILAMGAYMAIDPDIYVNGVSHFTPVWYQKRARKIMREMGQAVRGWMLGQLVDMIVVGVIVAIGLWMVGSPLAAILAILAGILTFVPYFGTIISAIPAIIVGLSVSLTEAIWIIGVFIVAHIVEGYVIAPFVQKRTVRLPPALTLVSFVIMVALFGIFAVLIATPLMACLMVGVARIYVEDILDDPAGKALSVSSRWYWFKPPDDTAGEDQAG